MTRPVTAVDEGDDISPAPVSGYMLDLLFDTAFDWQTKAIIAATLSAVVLVLIVFPVYLLSGGLRTFGLGALERCFQGIPLHESPQSGDVCFRYHTYRGFLLWFVQTEHVVISPTADAERLLGRLLRYNLTWGLLSYGAVFIVPLSIANYAAQKRSIRRQANASGAGLPSSAHRTDAL